VLRDTHAAIRIVRITGVNGMEISLDQMNNIKTAFYKETQVLNETSLEKAVWDCRFGGRWKNGHYNRIPKW